MESMEPWKAASSAQYILEGVLWKPVKITKVEEKSDTSDAEVTYIIRGTRKACTALLDVTFPFAEKSVNEYIQEAQASDKPISLIFGPGYYTSTVLRNQNPKETYIITDMGFWLSEKGNRHLTTSTRLAQKDVLSKWTPHAPNCHFFNRLNLPSITENSFDMIQLVNVLSDPSVESDILPQITRLLKSETGKLFIAHTNTAAMYSLSRLQWYANQNNCDLEILWEWTEEYPRIPSDVVAQVKQEYFFEQLTNYGGMDGFIAVLRKK